MNQTFTKQNTTTKVPSAQELLLTNDPPHFLIDVQNKEQARKDDIIKTVKVQASHLQFFPNDHDHNKEEKTRSDYNSLGDTDAFSEEVFDTVPSLNNVSKKLFLKPTVRFDSDLNILKTHSEVIRETEDVDASSLQDPETVKSIMKVTKDYYRMEQLRQVCLVT